jgi:hypothetical protein
MDSTSLMSEFQKLPSSAKQEVADFIEFISFKYLPASKVGKKKSKNIQDFKFNWENSISEYKKEFSSVELQHKATEWRGF